MEGQGLHPLRPAPLQHRDDRLHDRLRGVKANLARKAAGGDRDVARDILGGICDIGLANAYVGT